MAGARELAKLLAAVAAVVHCATASVCDPSATRTDCGYLGINEQECEAKKCCWFPADNQPWCFYQNGATPNGTCQANATRHDCGYVGIDQMQCEDKGCCWSPEQGKAYCFYKTSSYSYVVSNVTKTKLGVSLTLNFNGSSNSTPYGADISPLQVDFEQQTNDRLHVKIFDPNNQRWEVPRNISPSPTPPSSPPPSPQYDYIIPKMGEVFNFSIIRRVDNSTLFNTSETGILRFVDQYLSIGTSLPTDYNIYGLGEHVLNQFRLNGNQTLTLFNVDEGTPVSHNLYGSHPFYLEVRPTGLSHGVYLRNSNGMDITLGPDYLTYNVIGGVLDFYFFLGPQPEEVVQQYQEVIGRPHMPPYWGLGFHNCRYGYPNVETLEEVVANYSKAQIPLETMWTDIDYMDQKEDFTFDPVNFPVSKMQKFVTQLHDNGQHYVVIVDPGIKIESGYPPYDQGLKEDIFIKDKNGNNFEGQVWPGKTTFPDFLNLQTHSYWKQQISSFLQLVPVDGLWIDMNEISNFCNGECASREEMDIVELLYLGDKIKLSSQKKSSIVKRSMGFDPVNPPYAINNFASKAPLNTKTLDMDALHLNNTVLEYNAHNLYGISEAIATSNALENLSEGKRSFVISRSTFPGSGTYTGHWTGDNFSEITYLAHSIVGMLNFQLFGIPLIGSDICGFIGSTTVELCSRWIEVGAFYPFSRDHNTKGAPSQELYRWPQVAEISRKVLAIRYSLLPYYYTLFYKAHRAVDSSLAPAATVVRPLFFEFPTDPETYGIGSQFLVGPALLVSPVTQLGVTLKSVYFPKGKWYDWYSHSVVTDTGGTLLLPTPVDHIQVQVRGGYIIPLQQPGMTTSASRQNPFSLLVALNDTGSAVGDVFLDDGESVVMNNYTFLDFLCEKNTIVSVVSGSGSPTYLPTLSSATVLGVASPASKATINGKAISSVQYNSTVHSLVLSGFQTPLNKPFTITWE